ncbi:MAG: HDOD domain-containing protein [Armatimonadetes bacterium]|nr:HDOD domain-containing protein [Armatimonadota bacterium]
MRADEPRSLDEYRSLFRRTVTLGRRWTDFADLVTLTSQVNISLRGIHEVAGKNPEFAARVLRMARSAAYGAGHAKTLAHAMAFIGIPAVMSILLSLAIHGMTVIREGADGFDGRAFLRRCLALGFLCKAMAYRTQSVEPEAAYLMGLLQDCGYLALTHFAWSQFRDLTSAVKAAPGEQLIVIERECLGYDHAQIGGVLAEEWKFDPVLRSAISFHHAPAEAPAEHRHAADLGHMSSCVCDDIGFPPFPGAQRNAADPLSFERSGIDPAYVIRLTDSIREQASQAEVSLYAA